MNDTAHDSLRYPIGEYQPPNAISAEQRTVWIDSIATLPSELASVVAGLTNNQLDTPYRPSGWTVRQVIHHLADSHMNSVIRFRWALTEDTPLIKAYDEAIWANLPDAKLLPPEVSLELLTGLHRRWAGLLAHMSASDFERCLRHPALGQISLSWMLGLYAWHGRHHLAHISRLKDRMGWAV